MELKEVIARLRTTGRWNPFLRCFLLILAFIAFTIAFSIPLAVVFGTLTATTGLLIVGSLAFLISMVAQFLGAVCAVWLFRRTLDRLSFASLGLELRPGWRRELGWGFALGVGLMLLSVAVFSLFGWVELSGSGWEDGALASIVVWGLIGTLGMAMGAFYEELVARGYLIQNLSAGSNIVVGVILSSVVFGAAHLGNPNSSLLAAINTGLAGLLFALIYLWTNSLWAPFATHFGWNFAQNYIMGLPVSGLDIFANRSPFLLRETGPDTLTGGAFGPEGGIVVTAVLVAASLYFLFRLLAGQGQCSEIDSPFESAAEESQS